MADHQLEIEAPPRVIQPGCDLDTSLLSLVWRATQRWSAEIGQLRGSLQSARDHESAAWIALADECFYLRGVYDSLLPAPEQAGLARGAQSLAIAIRRIEQALRSHDVDIIAPAGSAYSSELSEIMENVGQVVRSDIAAPIIQEVLVPIVRRNDEVIRFGKAIIGVPEQR